MAYYAFLDDHDTVSAIMPGENQDVHGPTHIHWLGALLGHTCGQMYYDIHANRSPNGTAWCKNYAGMGFGYHADPAALVPPQCMVSVSMLTKNIWYWDQKNNSLEGR